MPPITPFTPISTPTTAAASLSVALGAISDRGLSPDGTAEDISKGFEEKNTQIARVLGEQLRKLYFWMNGTEDPLEVEEKEKPKKRKGSSKKSKEPSKTKGKSRSRKSSGSRFGVTRVNPFDNDRYAFIFENGKVSRFSDYVNPSDATFNNRNNLVLEIESGIANFPGSDQRVNLLTNDSPVNAGNYTLTPFRSDDGSAASMIERVNGTGDIDQRLVVTFDRQNQMNDVYAISPNSQTIARFSSDSSRPSETSTSSTNQNQIISQILPGARPMGVTTTDAPRQTTEVDSGSGDLSGDDDQQPVSATATSASITPTPPTLTATTTDRSPITEEPSSDDYFQNATEEVTSPPIGSTQIPLSSSVPAFTSSDRDTVTTPPADRFSTSGRADPSSTPAGLATTTNQTATSQGGVGSDIGSGSGSDGFTSSSQSPLTSSGPASTSAGQEPRSTNQPADRFSTSGRADPATTSSGLATGTRQPATSQGGVGSGESDPATTSSGLATGTRQPATRQGIIGSGSGSGSDDQSGERESGIGSDGDVPASTSTGLTTTTDQPTTSQGSDLYGSGSDDQSGESEIGTGSDGDVPASTSTGLTTTTDQPTTNQNSFGSGSGSGIGSGSESGIGSGSGSGSGIDSDDIGGDGNDDANHVPPSRRASTIAGAVAGAAVVVAGVAVAENARRNRRNRRAAYVVEPGLPDDDVREAAGHREAAYRVGPGSPDDAEAVVGHREAAYAAARDDLERGAPTGGWFDITGTHGEETELDSMDEMEDSVFVTRSDQPDGSPVVRHEEDFRLPGAPVAKTMTLAGGKSRIATVTSL